ncbi:MAG: DinB family protein, partial [Armatimonadota bacterium]
MSEATPKLDWILDGWVDYNDALLEALDAMGDDDLLRTDAPDRRSPADLLRHIALGRVVWLARIDAPGFAELEGQVPRHHVLPNGTRFLDEASVPLERTALRDWLVRTGGALRRTLAAWAAEDLRPAVRHDYQGTAY